MKKTLILATALFAAVGMQAQTPEGSIRTFRHPAPEVEALAMAAPVQSTSFNRMYSKAVIATQNCRSFPIAELAPNEARIGGLRINTMNFGLNRETVYDSIELLDVASGNTVAVKVPAGAKMKSIVWAPSGNAFAFTNTTEKAIDLYLVDVTVAEPVAKKVNTLRLNATLGTPFMFLSDTEILYKSVPAANVQAPQASVPFSNVIQDYTGSRKNGIRTYEDLIASPFDEDLYDYCCTSVLAIYSQEGTKTFGEPAIYRSLDPSPDGRYLMTVTEHHPYSYIETHRSFPSKQFIMDLDGNMVKMIEDGTVKKEQPAERGQDRTPRPTGFQWRPDLPATLVWTETKTTGGPGFGGPNGGQRPDAAPKADDAKKEKKPEATYTTKMYQCGAPFNYETDKTIVLSAKFRPGRVTWGDEGFAVYTETSTDKKERYTMTFVPCDTLAKKNILFTESTEKDSLGTFPVYGSIYTTRNKYNKSVVLTDAKKTAIYLSGSARKDAEGYTYRFLDKVTIKDGKITNIWNENNNGQKETLVTISDTNKKGKIIVTRESWNVVPDYHEIDLKNGKSRQITHLVNSVPQMDQLISKQIVNYTRKDGLKCFGVLYLPKNYDKERDGKLPVLMWTYPYEYQSFRESEEQRPDRYKFTKPSYGSAMIWATQGYAVLDDFTMSIVAEHPDSLPNNRFIEQLVMNAESAIDFVADSLGVGDRDRVAIGGHSYGGFMTANLLSHTRLFKAGIARSGAYMRSLTPFGFQSERRNFWKAKDVYDEMSPFNYADKVKDALLIIHGQMDDNMGTFPVQSERLYQALVYFGATARYVQLPLEAHSYYGKETTLDMLYETGAWLDKYVKNWKPEPKKEAKAQGNKLNIRFATAEETNRQLSQTSSYTDGWGRFDIQSRAGKVDATFDDLMAFRQTQGVDFTQAEKDSLMAAAHQIEKIADENGWHLPINTEVVIAKTTMKEEGSAGGYTLENWIYLGGKLDRRAPVSLLAHELNHVLTRNNRDYRNALYKTIGFEVLDHEIEFPKDVMDKKISNPDVAFYDSYAMLTVGGKKQPCTMMIYSSKDYSEMVGQSFFRNMEIGLIPLDSNNKPVVENGKTVIYPLAECPDFYDLVGKNTGYVINPEECLADNFALLFAPGRRAPQTPELLDKIKEVLKKRW